MIRKEEFIALVDTCMKPYCKNLDSLEEGIGVHIADGWLVTTIDIVLDTTARMCLNDELAEQLQSKDYEISKQARLQLETVIDMIYHYSFGGEFGNKPEQLTALLVLKNKETKERVKSFDAFDASSLYDAIYTYLYDSDEYFCHIDVSTRRNYKT